MYRYCFVKLENKMKMRVIREVRLDQWPRDTCIHKMPADTTFKHLEGRQHQPQESRALWHRYFFEMGRRTGETTPTREIISVNKQSGLGFQIARPIPGPTLSNLSTEFSLFYLKVLIIFSNTDVGTC